MNSMPLENMNHILSLLRANYSSHTTDVSLCLTKTERDIQGVQEDIQSILHDIRQLEGKISSLRIAQRGLEWRASRYRSLLAPVRRIPPEVLSYIFELASLNGCSIIETVHSPPVQLSQVCASWRDLARRTPKLWSHISIFEEAFSRPSHQVKSFVTAHLELSKNSPLYVDLEMPELINRDNELALFVIQTLVSHSARWKELYLNNMAPFSQQLSAIRGRLPLLQDLWLHSKLDVDLDAFELAPSLRTLKSNSGACSLIRLPWNQVTMCQILNSSSSIALQELSLASHCNEVELLDCAIKESEGPVQHIVHNLRSLLIGVNREYPDFHYWFNRLTLPRLTSLSIAGLEEAPPISCQSALASDYFPVFLSRSSCTITSLSLIDLLLSASDALALLSALPLLSSLTIHESAVKPFKNNILTAQFFNSFAIDHDNPFSNRQSASTKHLRSLNLRLHATLPAKLIVEVIESRWIVDPEYSAVLGIDDLSAVEIVVLRSEGATMLDVQELCDSLDWIRRRELQFTCSSKFLEAKET
ncbi:hypothetical protein D9758_008249 [Tetrapyrgos nigripes]|uniref:F-box domain-containing protein n=1 Tax=Tetrapyrgos nigripes TaxID=182062 RepID=A0A8H5LGV0_9AGAR|nr:hypothetical protein D9758_008249 [Tetrapyrgos nigripes]